MLRELHAELGIPGDYGLDGRKPAYEEATELVDAGPNIVGRRQRLAPVPAARWTAMQSAAADDGVALLLVSGFRSIDYQARLIRKKINAGQSLDDILALVAAPGFSEHHTGRAVDVATPGSRPLTEEFEDSAAFAWLTGNAGHFGFGLSYPRGNPVGFAYEPWHWAWHE
jgi:D-alanyl-D-alanine carboxypeptidase